MPCKTARKPILVAFFGNPHAGDDAFGCLVADALKAHSHPELELLDLSSENPTALLDHLHHTQDLIIVDAVCVPNATPGELVDLNWYVEARPVLLHDLTLSTHSLRVDQQVQLATALGIAPPKIRLLGSTLNSVKPGSTPCASMRSAAAEVTRRILSSSSSKR